MNAPGKHVLLTSGWIEPEGSSMTGNWTLEIVGGRRLVEFAALQAKGDLQSQELRKMYTNNVRLNTRSISGIWIKRMTPKIGDTIRIDDKFEWAVVEIDENQRWLGCVRLEYEHDA